MKPIIGIQRLCRLVEGRGIETHEIPQSSHRRGVLVLVLVLVLELINNSLHEHLVQLKLLHHCGHVVRGGGGSLAPRPSPRPPRPAILLKFNRGNSEMIILSRYRNKNKVMR